MVGSARLQQLGSGGGYQSADGVGRGEVWCGVRVDGERHGGVPGPVRIGIQLGPGALMLSWLLLRARLVSSSG